MRHLSLATIFAALSGFVVIIVASWALDVGDYEKFQAFWGLFFGLTGLIDGITHETTRGISAVREGARTGSARPWRLGAVIGIALAVLSPVLLFLIDATSAFFLLAIGVLSYAFQAVLMALLAGNQIWPRYALLVAVDSGVRLVLSVLAWAAGWGLWGFYIVTIIGALTWMLLLRGAPAAVVDVSVPAYVRRVLSAMVASGASAALITGFPVLLQATNAEPTTLTGVTLGGIMIAITLTRAPILVPVQRFQSALIVRFVNQPRVTALAQPLGLVLLVGVIGAGLAWLIGPTLMSVFFREDYYVTGWVLALLTFASACTGALIITGAAALAMEKHSFYVGGWITATVVAFAFLALPLPLELAAGLALIIGPICGGVVHAWALRGRAPSPR